MRNSAFAVRYTPLATRRRRPNNIKLATPKNSDTIPMPPQPRADPPAPYVSVPGRFGGPTSGTASPGSTVISREAVAVSVVPPEVVVITVTEIGITSSASPSLTYVCGTAKLVARVDPDRPADILATLTSVITQDDSAISSENDATVMLCRATERGVGWKNNLLAPFRVLGAVADKTQFR